MNEKDHGRREYDDDNLVTNKEIVHRLMDKIDHLDENMTNLDKRLDSIERVIKKYNNLRGTLGETKEEVQELKQEINDHNTEDDTKDDIKEALKGWTHWLVAILAILLYLSQLGII